MIHQQFRYFQAYEEFEIDEGAWASTRGHFKGRCLLAILQLKSRDELIAAGAALGNKNAAIEIFESALAKEKIAQSQKEWDQLQKKTGLNFPDDRQVSTVLRDSLENAKTKTQFHGFENRSGIVSEEIRPPITTVVFTKNPWQFELTAFKSTVLGIVVRSSPYAQIEAKHFDEIFKIENEFEKMNLVLNLELFYSTFGYEKRGDRPTDFLKPV